MKGASARRSHGNSEALESWMPQTTGVAGSIPAAAATLPSIGPRIREAGTTGGNSACQPARVTSDEKRPAPGAQRSV